MRLLIITSIAFISCINNINHNNKRSYQDIVNNIQLEQAKWYSYSQDSTFFKKCSALLFTTLTDSIFPAWNGTVWDFNGTTNIPGEGTIACGYFVSTTLKHVGFNLNRYKLAQQASQIIVEQVCRKEHSKTIVSYKKVCEYLNDKKEGLYLVGLDNHVGFISIINNQVYFIHSDYYHGKVVKEEIKNSNSFQISNVFVLGELTNNKKLLEKWAQKVVIYG